MLEDIVPPIPTEQTGTTTNTKVKVLLPLLFGVCIFGGILYAGITLNGSKDNATPKPTQTPLQYPQVLKAETQAPPKVATQAADPSGLTTYNQPQGIYSLKYPASWTMIEQTDKSCGPIFSPTEENQLGKSAFLTLCGILVKAQDTLDDVASRNVGEGETLVKKEEASIDNHIAVKISLKKENEYIIRYYPNYQIGINNQAGILGVYVDNKEGASPSAYQKQFDQIIASIKLSGNSPSQKTYKDDETGYKIFYPATWDLQKTQGKDSKASNPTNMISGIQLVKPNQPFGIAISTYKKQDAATIIDWWNKYSPFNTNGAEKYDKTNFSFKGADSIKRSYTPNQQGKVGDQIIFLSKDYVYAINMEYPADTPSKELLDIAYSIAVQ